MKIALIQSERFGRVCVKRRNGDESEKAVAGHRASVINVTYGVSFYLLALPCARDSIGTEMGSGDRGGVVFNRDNGGARRCLLSRH